MKLCLLDFETYFDEDYTLKKLTTTAYVRDPRFRTLGVGIQLDKSKAKWYPATKVQAALAKIDWTRTAVVAHNAHFDGFILSHHYGIIPAFYYCTLSMSRPFHGLIAGNDLNNLARLYGIRGKVEGYLDGDLDKLAQGCLRDVEIMEHVFAKMRPSFPESELQLIDLTIRMYCRPLLKVNQRKLKTIHKEEQKKREETLQLVSWFSREIFPKIEPLKAVRSRDKFAKLLATAGAEVPMKMNAKGEMTYAFAKTDLDFQALRDHKEERVRALIEAREIASSSIGATRALRLLEHGVPTLPVYLNYGQAHTLRWSGGDKINLQNLPRDGKLRSCIQAPKGYRLVVGDSAQIEARVLAWLAGETELVEGFRAGVDLYKEFASQHIFKVPLEKVTKAQRFVGKVSILALGYGLGAARFQHTLESGSMGQVVKFTQAYFDPNTKTTLELSDEGFYKAIVQAYRAKYSNIPALWRRLGESLKQMMNRQGSADYGPLRFTHERCHLPNGLFLRYPHLRTEFEPTGDGERSRAVTVYDEYTRLWGGTFCENIVQALARIVVADQALLIADRFPIVLLVHDEIVCCVPTKDARACKTVLLNALCTPPTWAPDLPVSGEVGVSAVYAKP